MIKVLISADIAPTELNNDLFIRGNAEEIVGKELLAKIKKADYFISNLETPLADKKTPILKAGANNMMAPTATINGIKSINPFFLCLSNNHIMDQGVEGLYSTIETLDKNSIAHAGAGNNLENARKPHIVEIENIKIGIYCCCEHEFSQTEGDYPGANPYDPLESFDDVQTLKNRCDYVIVLYHGGKEHYRYPTPQMKKVFHKFSDKGADIVIAQHTHCIGCREEYNNSELVYGQGNFVFAEEGCDMDYWGTSLLIELCIDKIDTRTNASVDYLPIISENKTIRIAGNIEAKRILDVFNARSEEVRDGEQLGELFSNYCREYCTTYAKNVSGERNILRRVVSKYFHKSFDYFYPNERILSLYNVLECETHREIILGELKQCIKEKEKNGNVF